MTVLAATAWKTNGEMIADVVELGYIRPDDTVVDLTFGKGVWWKNYTHWKTGKFLCNVGPHPDLDPGEVIQQTETLAVLYADFRDTRLDPDFFDVVLFDPPYVAMGGRQTSKLPDFMARYGLEDAPRTPADLHEHNVCGLLEAHRICKPGGFVMTKCADYISSGRLHLATHWMVDSALDIGFQVHDKLTMVGTVRPQPPGRRTVHARQNASVLLVLKKRGRLRTSDRKGRS